MTTAPAPSGDGSAERPGGLRWLLGSRSDPVLLRPALLAVLLSTAGLYGWVFATAVL
jgi:hypothetical protein